MIYLAPPWVVEIAHWSALVPLAFLLALRRGAAVGYWIVALSFAASWYVDEGFAYFGVTWGVAAWLAVVQSGLFTVAVASATLGAAVVAVTAILALNGAPLIWPLVVGSLAVLLLAKDSPVFWSLAVYCGVATILYLGMVQYVEPRNDDAFMRWWFPYQGARLASFALFVRAAWK